jgi:uncharacterized SAM-binding protein YcdF (DUF218 family)
VPLYRFNRRLSQTATFAHDQFPHMLEWLYNRLTKKDAPCPADLIFVLAGKMERKRYGLELYRAGFAKRLLVSVGRFEVSKMSGLPIPSTAELIAKRDRTSPEKRHFFCQIDEHQTRIFNPNLRRWNTYGEVLALRDHLADKLPSRLIVVSTDVHLRRVALVFEKVFRDSAVEFQYCSVPHQQSSLSKDRWWTRPDDRNYVIRETIKLVGYRFILLLPGFAVRWCMRLRD